MAQLEEQKGASAAVKALARKIRESQERDIQELQRHGKSAASSRSSGAADTTMAVPMERETQRTMSRLQSASGAALDHAFLEEMAKHHEMAISMSQGAKLQDPQLTRLAEKMRQSQQQELGELKQQLTSHGTAK